LLEEDLHLASKVHRALLPQGGRLLRFPARPTGRFHPDRNSRYHGQRASRGSSYVQCTGGFAYPGRRYPLACRAHIAAESMAVPECPGHQVHFAILS
jgi:hypothetical protein